jgi:uncharacterized protein DUF3429
MNLVASRVDRLPPAAIILGAAGALPLLAGVCLALAAPTAFDFPVIHATLAYAALVLSFLGGIHWGLASGVLARDSLEPEATRVLVLSALPPLAGWLGTFLPGRWGPAVLVTAFLAVLLLDHLTERLGYAPGWWMWLRVRLTGIVVALLLLLAVGGSFS